MTKLTKPEMPLTTFYKGPTPVNSTPLGDLILARRLLQQALDNACLPAACLYAIAISKLVGPVKTWMLTSHEGLYEAAAGRVAVEWVHAISAFLEKNKIPDHHFMVGRIGDLFANQIQKDEKQL